MGSRFSRIISEGKKLTRCGQISLHFMPVPMILSCSTCCFFFVILCPLCYLSLPCTPGGRGSGTHCNREPSVIRLYLPGWTLPHAQVPRRCSYHGAHCYSFTKGSTPKNARVLTKQQTERNAKEQPFALICSCIAVFLFISLAIVGLVCQPIL